MAAKIAASNDHCASKELTKSSTAPWICPAGLTY
ncbi:hypothetical protein CI1B_74690 [Bradyrhizobium ivorense]|uniref:Uncharacterized protein n=1 Tax=Bradyrhizobium ivorense TaxID=2511166 RepID=A0A508TVS5_9BRAD|nr:hypothetical protein CI1B_74690 [Bradyrhizobium ivorense]